MKMTLPATFGQKMRPQDIRPPAAAQQSPVVDGQSANTRPGGVDSIGGYYAANWRDDFNRRVSDLSALDEAGTRPDWEAAYQAFHSLVNHPDMRIDQTELERLAGVARGMTFKDGMAPDWMGRLDSLLELNKYRVAQSMAQAAERKAQRGGPVAAQAAAPSVVPPAAPQPMAIKPITSAYGRRGLLGV